MHGRKHRYWNDLKHPRSFAELVSNVAIEATDNIIWPTLNVRLHDMYAILHAQGLSESTTRKLDNVITDIVVEVIKTAARAGCGLALTPMCHNSFEEWEVASLDKAGLVSYEMELGMHWLDEDK